MILNLFIVHALRGEINEKDKNLGFQYANEIIPSTGIWVTDSDTWIANPDTNIKFNHIIANPFTDLSKDINLKSGMTYYSSIKQFIDEAYKNIGINQTVNFYTINPEIYKQVDVWAEGATVMLINKMYENATSFIDNEWFNNNYEIIDDSGLIRFSGGSYKKLKYIKRMY